MKLILSKNDYLAMKPVYGFVLPNYLEQILEITIDEYYEASMIMTQRIINAYVQNFLSDLDWTIDNLDLNLQEQIKHILFCELDYLHQNQMFFKKNNDITYSTSGQQTFSYNPQLDENDVSLIPDYVVKMIKNTGILKFADTYIKEANERELASNEFTDGVFVNDVAWNSKADNILVYNGQNYTVAQALSDLGSDKVSNTDTNYINAINLANNFEVQTNKIISNKLLSSNQVIANKTNVDYAQISDLTNLWNGSNSLIQNNTKDIQTIQTQISNLEQNKVDNNDFQIYLNNKANTNFDNVKLAPRNQIQNVQVNYDGTLTYEQATGNLAPKKWNPERLYDVDGESIWIDDNGTAKIFISTGTENNINQSPLTTTGYWVPYQADFNLDGYLTDEEGANKFLSVNGGTLSGNLNLQGNKLLNASNVLTKEAINDNVVGIETLWSSSKTNEEIQGQALLLNSANNQTATTQFTFSNIQNFNDGININNPANQQTVNLKVDENGNLLANNQNVIQNLDEYYTKDEVNKLIDAVGGEVVIDNKFIVVRENVLAIPNNIIETITANNNITFHNYTLNANVLTEVNDLLNNGYFVTEIGISDYPYTSSTSRITINVLDWNVIKVNKKWMLFNASFQLNNITNQNIILNLSKLRFTVNLSKTYAISKELAKCYQKYENVTIDENGVSANAFALNNTNFASLLNGDIVIRSAQIATTNNQPFSSLHQNQVPNRNQIQNYVQAAIDNIPPSQTSIVAGHNIVIENSNIVSTIDDVDFDSVSINGVDVETTINLLQTDLGNVNEQIVNHTNQINQQANAITKINGEMAQINGYFQNGNVIRFRGTWSATIDYLIGDYVIQNDDSYIALEDNTNKQPSSNPTIWSKQNMAPTIDLSNYYTKSEVDSTIQSVENSIESLNTSIDLANEAINETKTELTTLTNFVNTINTRLTNLEQATKSKLTYWARIKTSDGSVNIQIFNQNFTIQTIGSGMVNCRFISGYSDLGNFTSSFNNNYVFNNNGLCTFSFSQNTMYQQAYEYFNLGIKITIDGISYGNNIKIGPHQYNDYDYNSVYNFTWLQLIPA